MSMPKLTYARAMIADITPRRSPTCSNSSMARSYRLTLASKSEATGVSARISFGVSPAARRTMIAATSPLSTCSMYHSRTLAMEVTPSSRSAAAWAATSPSSSASSHARPKASAAASRSTSFGALNDSPRGLRIRSCPSSRHAASSAARSPRALAVSRTDLASSAA